MRRGLRAVAAGLLVAGASMAAGAAAGTAAAAGAGPVATPPAAPQTQTVSGVAVNGVQLSMTAPAQLPLDLPGQQLSEREVDVTVKDVGGQGYSGSVSTTLTPEGSGASTASLRVDHYDPASDAWQTETVPTGDPSFTLTDTVTVPANGTQVLKLRLSPGTAAAADVKLTAAANGAQAVATVPVTGPAFQASGLTAVARAGAPVVLTGKLTNPTDVGLQDVPVKLVMCSAGAAGCVAHASDVKVEVQIGAAWHVVPVTGGASGSMMTATVVPDLALPAGGTAQFAVRVTVGPGAFGTQGSGSPTSQTPAQTSAQPPAQPMTVPLALGPIGLTLVGQPTISGTLTVQPPPQPTPTTPSSTPSSSATSATPTATDSPTTSGTPTAAPTGTPAGPADPASSIEAASTPGAASSSSNPTILVAAGLLAVCLALVLWWVLMKRRDRMAHAHAAAGHVQDSEHADEAEH